MNDHCRRPTGVDQIRSLATKRSETPAGPRCFRGSMRSPNRRSTRSVVAVATAILLIAASLVPVAAGNGDRERSSFDNAWYKASRPGFTVVLRTEDHRIAELRLRFKAHCSDGTTSQGAVTQPRFNRPFNPQTGRFRWVLSRTGDGLSVDQRLKGTVHRRKVTGHFASRTSTTLGGEVRRCWTGRSLRDAVVDFVARRQ